MLSVRLCCGRKEEGKRVERQEIRARSRPCDLASAPVTLAWTLSQRGENKPDWYLVPRLCKGEGGLSRRSSAATRANATLDLSPVPLSLLNDLSRQACFSLRFSLFSPSTTL